MRLPYFEHNHKFFVPSDEIITAAIDTWHKTKNLRKGQCGTIIASILACPSIFVPEYDCLKAYNGDIVMDFNHIFHLEWTLFPLGMDVYTGIYYEVQPAACKDTLFGLDKVPYRGWYIQKNIQNCLGTVAEHIGSDMLYKQSSLIRNCFFAQRFNGTKTFTCIEE